MSVLYTAIASAFGGREGTAKSDDGNLEVTLTMPKALGGNGAPGTNPEQLFAAGYSACFLSALKFVAAHLKVKLPEDTVVSAKVGIGPREGGFEIHPEISVSLPGLDRAVAEDLVAKAHIACPYSHALRTSKEVSAVLA